MRRRYTITATFVLATCLLLMSCSGDDDSSDADPPVDTEAAAETESTTTAPTTTAPIPEGGESVEGVQLTAVLFGDTGHVTVTNTTDADIGLDGLWLCNQPSYAALSGNLGPEESIDVPAGDLGGLLADGGEVALYTSDAFDSPDAMADYVQWGSGGGRASVAATAGLWPEGVTVEPTAELIELFGVPGDPEAWS